MTVPYFPDDAVACLRQSRYDPAAKAGLELMSGSFLWDDESDGYMSFIAHCRANGCMVYWEPIGYRSSVIRGNPNEGMRKGWEELQKACPEWPGFRPERYSASLRAELERQEAEEF